MVGGELTSFEGGRWGVLLSRFRGIASFEGSLLWEVYSSQLNRWKSVITKF